MSVNISRRVGMHVFVEVGDRLRRDCTRTAQLGDSLAAWRGRGIIATSAPAADRGQPLQKIMAAVCTISSELCIVFLPLARILL
jgi:hypothetical protein